MEVIEYIPPDEYIPTEEEINDEYATNCYIMWQYEGGKDLLTGYLDNTSGTPDLEGMLMLCIDHYFTCSIETLVQRGVDLNKRGPSNPLAVAIRELENDERQQPQARCEVIVELLKCGADPYLIKPNPLNCFGFVGHEDIIEMLLRNGADLSDVEEFTNMLFWPQIEAEQRRRKNRMMQALGFPRNF